MQIFTRTPITVSSRSNRSFVVKPASRNVKPEGRCSYTLPLLAASNQPPAAFLCALLAAERFALLKKCHADKFRPLAARRPRVQFRRNHEP